jgi:hypothetical protein
MARPQRHHVLNTLRIVLALFVVAAVAVAVARNWNEVSQDLGRVDASSLVWAAVLVCLGPVFTLLGWRTLLADLGSPLHLAPAGGVFFVGQLGKYVPGTVWSIVAQAEMGTRLHIPRRRSAVVGLITVGMAAICAFIVGLPALPFLFRRDDSRAVGWTLLLVLPLLGVLLWPRLLNRLMSIGLRVLRRDPLEHELSARALLLTTVYFICAWVCVGAHAWVLVRAISPADTDPGSLAVASVCGFALASALAMFSVVLPAGVGVREGLLVLMLAPATSTSAATAVVVLARFFTTLADVLFAVAGWAWARSHHLITSRAERAHDGVLLEEPETVEKP